MSEVRPLNAAKNITKAFSVIRTDHAVLMKLTTDITTAYAVITTDYAA